MRQILRCKTSAVIHSLPRLRQAVRRLLAQDETAANNGLGLLRGHLLHRALQADCYDNGVAASTTSRKASTNC